MISVQSFNTAVMFVALLLLSAAASRAQEPGSRAEQQAREQEEKSRSLSAYKPGFFERQILSIEESGGFGVARGVFVTFGDIKRGSGFALGPAYGKAFASGAVFQAKAVYSVAQYKLAQVSLRSAPLADGRLRLAGRLRWQDAPTVRFYGLGPTSPNTRANYAETMSEASGAASYRPVRLLRFDAGIGIEQFDTGAASDADPSRDRIFDGVPGFGADPRYLHAYGSAAIDSRDGDGYSRRGSLLQATFHDYRQQNDGPFSFRRVDGVAEQYVPVLEGNWVFYAGLRASVTSPDSGGTVPFFLMPDLGGGGDLRGFSTYRFRDRHSLLFTAEYRWYAQEYLDAAIFYDAGKTVPDRSALNFRQLQSSYGAGIRLHGPRFTALRFEVARSREGVRLIVAFSPVGG